MKNTKMNNKGFSLVELIVVVLIMAIIAVALAPQVMKWVTVSRESKDVNAVGAIMSAIKTETMVKAPTGEITVVVSPGANPTVTETPDTDNYDDIVTDLLGEYSSYQCASKGTYTITVEAGKSEVKCAVTSYSKYFDTLSHDGITTSGSPVD